MPRWVECSPPVRTTWRPCRSRSGTTTSPASTVTLWSTGRVTGSARVARLGPCAALGRLLLAVLGRSGGHQVVEQVLSDVGDLVDGAVEGLLVRRGRPGRPADLAHELERRVAHLLRGGGRLEVVERSDVAAHDTEPTWTRQQPRAHRPVALVGRFPLLRRWPA